MDINNFYARNYFLYWWQSPIILCDTLYLDYGFLYNVLTNGIKEVEIKQKFIESYKI